MDLKQGINVLMPRFRGIPVVPPLTYSSPPDYQLCRCIKYKKFSKKNILVSIFENTVIFLFFFTGIVKVNSKQPLFIYFM